MKKNAKISSFTKEVPYLFSNDGITILKDGTIFTGLELSGIDTFTFTISHLEAIKKQFAQIFKDLPEGYVVQVIHDYHCDVMDTIQAYESNLDSPHPISAAFKESYMLKLKNNSSNKKANLYCFIIKPAKSQINSFTDFLEKIDALSSRVMKRRGKRDKGDDLSKIFKKASSEVSYHSKQVKNQLESDLGIIAKSLPVTKLEALIYKLLNPSRIQAQIRQKSDFTIHKNHIHSFLTMRERLTNSTCHVYSDKIKLDKTFYKVLTLRQEPNATVAGDADAFLYNLSFPFMMSFNFTVLNTAKVNAKLEAKQKRKYAYVASSSNPNIGSSVSKSQLERAIEDQKRDKFLWHDTSLSFLVFDTDEAVLDDKANYIMNRCASMHDMEVVEDTYKQLKYFIASLPGCGHLNDRTHKFTSLNVNDLVPISVPDKGTTEAAVMFHSYRDTLFQFSTFSDDFNTWNQVVIGKTGSGKSFIVNNILTASLMGIKNPQVMILDLGKSFKKITELWGGKYLTIDLDNPERGLNPLPPRETIIGKEGFASLGLLDFTVQLILLMVQNSQDEQLKGRIIRKALLETYGQIKDRQPILSDLQKILYEYEKYSSDSADIMMAGTVAKFLDEFTEGAYSKIFNRESDLTMDSNFFCFDFKEAHSNPLIREIATYIIGGYISRKMTANPDPKFIIFDEFATTMQHETGAVLCKMIAKNCRKHGVSFICISQELKDFLDNSAAQAVYNQSNIKWFLKLDDNLKAYQDHLRLTERDVEIIRNLHTKKGEYSQVYLNYGDKKTLLSLQPDPLMYWACTNDAKDNKMQTAYKKYFNTSDIEVLTELAKKYPKGVKDEDFKIDPIFNSKEEPCAA
jgi:type IV secretory pathway VirB4 component